MNHRRSHLPRRRKAGVELRNCITKGAKQLTSIIGRRTQTLHQGPERFAFDVFHDHAKLVAHAVAIDNPRQVLVTSPGTLGRKQAFIRPTNLGRRVDALANKGTKRSSAGALKVHELGRLDVGVLEHTVYAIAVITLK